MRGVPDRTAAQLVSRIAFGIVLSHFELPLYPLPHPNGAPRRGHAKRSGRIAQLPTGASACGENAMALLYGKALG